MHISPSLSLREKEILTLIAYERTTKEISKELFISTETVNTHRRNIMSKLNVCNMAGLVRVGMEHGIVGEVFKGQLKG